MVCLTVNDNTGNMTVISLLRNNEIPRGSNKGKVTRKIWRTTVPNLNIGVLGIGDGFVVQQVYVWPFWKQLELDHIKLFETAFKGTPRDVTSIDGLYQNFGPRSTAQCPGLLGDHPRTAMNQNNWSWKNNLTIIHQLIVKIRNVLHQQSYYAGFLCGQMFASTLKIVTGSQYDDIFPQFLFTGLL